MFWLLLIGLWLSSSREALADIKICKFSFFSDSDWVQVCNDDGGEVNLGTYSLKDSGGNTVNLSAGCTLPNGKSYSRSFGNYLNKDGDYIALVNNGITVDCVSYGGVNCPSGGTHSTVTGDNCQALTSGSWAAAADCTNSGESQCLVPTATVTTAPQTPSPTPRTLGVKIMTLPSSSALGNTFEVKFQINGGNGNYEYYIKGFGGVNDNLSTEVDGPNGWVNYDGAWEKMPKFKTNDEGFTEAVVRLRAISSKETGLYRIRVKIKESIGPKEVESELKTIQIDKLPSATPTKKATPTPEASETIYPLPTEAAADNPTPTTVEILENSDITITPTPERTSNFNLAAILPIGLIGAGGLFLVIPLIVSKLKHGKDH